MFINLWRLFDKRYNVRSPLYTIYTYINSVLKYNKQTPCCWNIAIFIIRTDRNSGADIAFDDALVQGDTSGHLQANQLAVDNLTMDWVRGKMAELETRLKECQDALESSVDGKSESHSWVAHET